MIPPRTRRGLAAVAGALLLVMGCATGTGRDWSVEAGADATLEPGLQAFGAGRYDEAADHFRGLADRCDAGSHGRRAVLLLASTALDPRNPYASPGDAARFAAHFLTLPDAPPSEAIVAEALLVLALDRGAGAAWTVRPAEGLASRFQDCSEPAPEAPGEPPVIQLPGQPMAAVLARIRAERDSLWARVTELEAELQRIRGLLQEDTIPDSLGFRP